MLGPQIPSFCRMIGRNNHVWSHIVRMRKSDILQRGSQIKALNMKVYIEDMYREKTDINVLFFCKQRRRNHHNEDASKARRVWIGVNELYRLLQHLQKVVQILLIFIIYYMNKFSDLAEGVVMICRWQSIICKVEWAVFWKWRFVKRCKCHPSLKSNQKRHMVIKFLKIKSSFCNINNLARLFQASWSWTRK